MKREVIRGGSVVTPSGMQHADILVEEGRIAGLFDPSVNVEGDAYIQADRCIVLPGVIDAHTHFIQNDPEFEPLNREEFEGFANGGRGAAAGGVTTVVEMPHSSPPTTSGQTFRRKRELAQTDAIVDFALWGGVTPGQRPDELREQIEEGATAFKAFMCDSDPTFPGIDDAQLLATLELLRPTPLMVGLHAESDALLRAGIARMRKSGRRDPLAHADSRPSIVETEAVGRAILFAEHMGARVHIVHISTPHAAELIKQAKNRRVLVTCETCPQYLALDLDDLERLGPYAKCAPALRSSAEVEAMWQYLRDGTIDCITSDHCGFTIESKEAGRSDIFLAPDGLSGIQTLLPVFITEARKRGLSWEEIAQLTATAPAKLWHLAPRKGAIQIGGDADLVLIDPARLWTISTDELLHTHHWTPFEGRSMEARVVQTLLRGETIYDDDDPHRVLVRPGFGRFVAPHY